MSYHLSNILAAYILDLILGDPQWRWHPIRIIGRMIEYLETKLNKDTANKIFSGTLLVILIVGLTCFFVWLILEIAKSIHPILHNIISILSIYFALSIRSLDREVNKVYLALNNLNLDAARKKLSMIVGRDTNNLDKSEIIRATIETVAESTMDGVIAPLLYVFLGGPILVWAYKAINTLDSMVGYRSERFIEFGKVSAKLDGLINFIPARITSFLIGVSIFCYRKDGFRSLKWTIKYFFKGITFNSEMTEAAMAGGLRVQLGGLNFYNSMPVKKTLIGDNLYPLDIKHIKESIVIVYMSSIFLITIGVSLSWFMGRR